MRLQNRRLNNLQEQLWQNTISKNNGCPYPGPAFFKGDEPDLQKKILEREADLLRQGYPMEYIEMTPVFIEDELAQ